MPLVKRYYQNLKKFIQEKNKMPIKVKHIEQFTSNQKFFEQIIKLDPKYFDWNITVLFYIILHYADALCADHGYSEFRGHAERENQLKKILPNKEFRLYLHLKNASIMARYKVKFLSKNSQEYCLKVHRDLFLPLKESIQKQL